jgi:hypothetical protein
MVSAVVREPPCTLLSPTSGVEAERWRPKRSIEILLYLVAITTFSTLQKECMGEEGLEELLRRAITSRGREGPEVKQLDVGIYHPEFV